MKKASLTELSLYLIVKFLALFFQALPISLSLLIGRRIGLLGMFLNAKRKHIAYANLKCAFAHKYTPSDLKKILVQSYANLGQGIVETTLLPKINKAYGERNFTYEGFEIIDQVLSKGKGAILLTGHFGNWEAANVALPFKGYPYKAIAREQKPFLVNQLLNSYRESHGCKIISKGMPIRDIIKSLRNNEIVGMLVDQDAGKDGIFVDLFNKPASWHRGVMEFALRTGCAVLPGFIIRQGGQKFKFKVYEPVVFPEATSEEEKIEAGFKQFVTRLQGVITKYPDQWLWQHKRWKSSPQKKVLILNDGRLGHLRQSQAVLSQLKKLYQSKGTSSENILTETIDLNFRSNVGKRALCLSGYLSRKACQGCMRCLKVCLNEQNYKQIMSTCADIIISCGSKVVSANLLLAKECNAKSIVIMNPGSFLIKKFNLAIIPKHDNPKEAKNIVITEGAPNLIDEDLIKYQAEGLKSGIGSMEDKKIGLLLGGNTKNFHMQEAGILKLIQQIKKSSEGVGADVLATTSRRTPGEIEAVLKAEFKSNKRCKLLIVANEDNREGVVGGILGLCDVVIVSPESISMISEAASSASYTVVFNADSALDSRHTLFLKNLQDKGYIQIVDIENISESINDFFKKKPEIKQLDDNEIIRKGLERII